MWTVVYLAKGKKLADMISSKISNESVLVKVQPVNKAAEEDEGYFEILVPEAEVEEAHSILYELGY